MKRNSTPCCKIGNIHANIITADEGFLTDLCYARRDGNAPKGGAFIEGITTYACQFTVFANDDAREAGAILKGSLAKAHYARREGYAC